MGLLDWITGIDGGPIRVREKGFAVANVPSLGRCAVESRGSRVRVEGAAGVADVIYECTKNSADVYGWDAQVGRTTTDTLTNKTLTTPTIASFANATHNHTNAAGGGTLTSAAVTDLGLILITSNSFSAQSSVSINNCFTSTYRNYRIIINIDSATASANLTMRMRASGSDHSSANYERGAVLRLTSGTTVTGINTAAGTEWPLIGLLNGAVDGCITIDLLNPQVANKTGGFYTSSYLSTATTVYTTLSGGLGMRVTTQFDGFSLIASSGTITGECRVYGIKN